MTLPKYLHFLLSHHLKVVRRCRSFIRGESEGSRRLNRGGVELSRSSSSISICLYRLDLFFLWPRIVKFYRSKSSRPKFSLRGDRGMPSDIVALKAATSGAKAQLSSCLRVRFSTNFTTANLVDLFDMGSQAKTLECNHFASQAKAQILQ